MNDWLRIMRTDDNPLVTDLFFQYHYTAKENISLKIHFGEIDIHPGYHFISYLHAPGRLGHQYSRNSKILSDFEYKFLQELESQGWPYSQFWVLLLTERAKV